MSKRPSPRSGLKGLEIVGIALALAALAACASPPPYVAVNHQRVVPLATRDVWLRLHAFLENQGIHVVSEDAAGGLIDARQDVSGKGLLSLYADCGGGGGLLSTLQRQTLDLTVRVRPVVDGAEVTAHAAFSQTLRARRAGAVTVACPTKGVLEEAILDVASGQPMEAAVIPR